MKMCGKNKRIINFIQVLILLVTFLIVAVPMSLTAADRGDSVKDKPLKKHLRTLEGKAFLDHPITGATVQIYDLSDSLLYSVESATGENGSFSITRRLPKSFWIEITDGYMDGEPFDHDVRRYIRLFKERDYYKVNAVTTLMAEYQDRYPKLSHMQVRKAVANHLSIPDSIDLDEIIYSSEWFCYHFSHYLFMKEAEAGEGLTQFISQLGDEIEAGETRSFYDIESVGSSFFQDAMKLLLKGALSELGGEGAGWILGLLTKGDGTDDRFSEMETDLQEIISTLNEILSRLSQLLQQLNIDTNELEQYMLGGNATLAISTIETHYGSSENENIKCTHNDLKYYSLFTAETFDPVTNGQQIKDFVSNVDGAWDIQTDMTLIHNTIMDSPIGLDGLLSLWTTELLLKDVALENAYTTLEHYFSVLLFYQFRGANLVVEALNYNDFTSGRTGQASSYLTETFQPRLKKQTDQFLKCVTRLIANNCGLYWESRFLPSTAQEILARATFFVTQTLGEDHYGLRAGLFGTSNLVHDILYVGTLKGYDLVMVPGEMVDVDVPDRPYDSWGTLNNPDLNMLSKGISYSLDKFDLGAFDPGTYKVYYTPAVDQWIYVGEAVVKTYTKDYIEDPDGEIAYGYLLGEFRRGGKEVIMDPSVFKRSYYHNNRDGEVNWWHDENLTDYLYLYVHGKNKYTNTNTYIDMKVHWLHSFTFDGNESTTAYLNIGGKVWGSVYRNVGNYTANAEIGFHVGVVDLTHDKVVKRIDDSFEAKVSGETRKYNKTLNDQISFTLEPGVTYYVYGNIWGNGENYNGDYEYINKMNLTHLSLTFVNSEF